MFRLFPPVFTDGSGNAARAIDLTAPPANAGPGQIAPGDTWNFQYWYRDQNPFLTSNLSSALRVDFR